MAPCHPFLGSMISHLQRQRLHLLLSIVHGAQDVCISGMSGSRAQSASSDACTPLASSLQNERCERAFTG